MIQRPLYLEKISRAFDFVPVVALIGSRQVGKSTLMKMYEKELKITVAFLNGQDPEVADIFQSFSTVKFWLDSKFANKNQAVLMIDEFQFIPGISLMIKLITDHFPGFKILCSGSSSLEIRQKVEESLAGRVRIIDVYSLSFTEYLKFTSPEDELLYASYPPAIEYAAMSKSLLNALNDFLMYGGFPRLAGAKSNDQKISLLNDIFQTYLVKDIRNFVRNEDTVGFNKILRLLSLQNANLININELSRLSGLVNRKCEEYLSLLEQMYIIRLIEPFPQSGRRSMVKMKKVYFLDTGLRNLIARNFNPKEQRTDFPFLVENFVFLELTKSFPAHTQINFYRTYDNLEIDFILNDFHRLYSVEVKSGIMNKAKRFAGLSDFNLQNQVFASVVVNENLNCIDSGLNFLPAILVPKIYATYHRGI